MTEIASDDQIELEDQFILRLPLKRAKFVKKALSKKPKAIQKYLKIDLNPDSGNALITVRKKVLVGKLKTLPTIIESYKTCDKKILCKTADICQILDCTKNKPNQIDYPHGITPPLKNVRKKRFRKCRLKLDDDREVIEKEVDYLLKADLEAVSTKFKFCYETKNKELIDSYSRWNKKQLFGEISSDSEIDVCN